MDYERMAVSQPEHTSPPYSAPHFRKRWVLYALTLSVVMHIGAALVLVIAGGIRMGGDTVHTFVFQDLTLSPSLSTAVKTADLPSDRHPAPPPPVTVPASESIRPAQEQTPEQPQESPDGTGSVRELMSTPLGMGMALGYFSGLADGRSLRDDVRGYYFEMVGRINREWWSKAGLLKESLRQDGIFEVFVQRDGNIVSVQILQKTGSRDADQLLTEIIKNASPLPPLPSSYERDQFRVPLRIKAPSFLYR